MLRGSFAHRLRSYTSFRSLMSIMALEHNARAFPFLGDSQEGVKRASPQG